MSKNRAFGPQKDWIDWDFGDASRVPKGKKKSGHHKTLPIDTDVCTECGLDLTECPHGKRERG